MKIGGIIIIVLYIFYIYEWKQILKGKRFWKELRQALPELNLSLTFS
jgi:hypothetical protein